MNTPHSSPRASIFSRLSSLCEFLLTFFTLIITSSPAFASTQDFYIDSFDAHYTVEKASDDTSKMKVVETITAVFPDTDQNHGITRDIPRTNAGGQNFTVEDKSSLHFSVTLNGKSVPSQVSCQSVAACTVRIGDASTYVHGRQVYRLEYEFARPVLGYDQGGQVTFDPEQIVSEELYWDTNGNGWSQKINQLTATVSFADSIKYQADTASCYVGRFGEQGSERCKTEKLRNGLRFSASNLKAGENLTFDIVLDKDAFVISQVEPPLDSSGAVSAEEQAKFMRKFIGFIVVIFITFFLPLFILIRVLRRSLRHGTSRRERAEALRAEKADHRDSKAKAAENRQAYRDLLCVPEYLPPNDLTIAESARLLRLNLGSAKVASLINLAVHHNIALQKGPQRLFGRFDWEIQVLSKDGAAETDLYVLRILNSGQMPESGDVIKIKRRSYNSSASHLASLYKINANTSLVGKGFFREYAKNYGFPSIERLSEEQIFRAITSSGLEQLNYLNGLKLYMKMAESERIKFLQSVKGADTTPQGIVKLYEKLLPYAILFGLEKSWLRELSRYYEDLNIEPAVPHVNTSSISRIESIAVSAIVAATTAPTTSSSSSSSSSHSSSSSSGSGGHGSSGGGGGGGGGGGW